jgi:hypothetical protein
MVGCIIVGGCEHLMKIISLLRQPVSTEIRFGKDANLTTSVLFGVAALQLLVGLLGWFVHSHDPDIEELRWFVYSYDRTRFGWLDWAVTFSGVIYAVFGIVARWAPLPAALAGAGIYGAFLALQSAQNVHWQAAGLVTKIPVVILLLAGVASASKHLMHKRESEHDAA